MVNKLVPAAAATLALFLTQALPAAACGGLVAPNGAIRLAKATTLVEWHNGVEHYLTSFSYHGEASSFGWIVPLPAVPEKVEEGGGWTLQRLFRETHPQPPILALDFAAGRAQATSAEVLQQVQVRALDITVLRGSGQAVLDWASENGFAVDAETRAHVLQYAKGSPIFMAAKYNAGRAQKQRLLFGDGAPGLITMKIPPPWAPLEIGAAGPGGGEPGGGAGGAGGAGPVLGGRGGGGARARGRRRKLGGHTPPPACPPQARGANGPARPCPSQGSVTGPRPAERRLAWH